MSIQFGSVYKLMNNVQFSGLSLVKQISQVAGPAGDLKVDYALDIDRRFPDDEVRLHSVNMDDFSVPVQSTSLGTQPAMQKLMDAFMSKIQKSPASFKISRKMRNLLTEVITTLQRGQHLTRDDAQGFLKAVRDYRYALPGYECNTDDLDAGRYDAFTDILFFFDKSGLKNFLRG